jgi:rhodanese-related sulfurtransferase
MKRRTFLISAALAPLALPHLGTAQTTQSDPWPPGDLLEPATLAALLKSGADQKVFSVAFPFLYRQRHIPGAQFAGPGSKPEGIAALKSAATKLPKNTSIVLYCGCCPMTHCPNIRPAYRTLKELGFTNVRVLNLPTNFHADWTAKGYPVEPAENHAS